MNNYSQLQCSTFKGFSKHKENKELLTLLLQIKSGTHQKITLRIREKTAAGDSKEAGNIKRQLPAATLSATYRERRTAENITGYNDVVILDFDKLTEQEITHCRQVIESSLNTLFCFLSPSGNGLKAGVYMQTNEANQLRKSTLNTESIPFDDLEEYHKKMFELAKTYYETLTGVSIDPSGSDIGRLFFLSHDPAIYINLEAIKAVKIPSLHVLPPAPVEKIPTAKDWLRIDMPGKPETCCEHVPASIQMEFQKCVRIQERTMKYERGGRDTFLFTLGNRCYRKELPQEAVETLVEKFFGTPEMDVRQPIRNAYQYTGKTDRQEQKKKEPIGKRIADFADTHYEIRYNVIMKRNEFKDKDMADFQPMKTKHYNSIFYDLNMAGINTSPGVVKTIINSRYAKDFNPFEDYFYNLPPWDGQTDYIGQLANTIQTSNQVFWCDCLRRWLTGVVACALDDTAVNQLALIIKGAQGKGKSTWIRNLLPPQLKLHYRNGMLNPDNKDHAMALTTCLLINLEEFEGMKGGEIADLKRLITQESVMERKAFDTDADLYIRRASIIASTNEPRFLQDITGTRRFPTITALEIDYRTPVNHAGIFAQALHLWKNKFRYWYENKEIDELNRQNQEYTLSAPEEELFYVHFAKPIPTDYIGIKWMPASAILTHLSIYGKIQVTANSQKKVVQVLERDGFEKRRSEHNLFEYHVRTKDL